MARLTMPKWWQSFAALRRGGAPIQVAMQRVGRRRQTYYHWLSRSEEFRSAVAELDVELYEIEQKRIQKDLARLYSTCQ